MSWGYVRGHHTESLELLLLLLATEGFLSSPHSFAAFLFQSSFFQLKLFCFESQDFLLPLFVGFC
jgi:hypothetical protein